ncbi:MAG: DNA-binding response regulator, partial [Burkholderiaceae bacterium]
MPLLAADGRQRRILVIEDEADLAQLLEVHLGELPAQVRTCGDGEQGLALALAEHWDAIVLDLR